MSHRRRNYGASVYVSRKKRFYIPNTDFKRLLDEDVLSSTQIDGDPEASTQEYSSNENLIDDIEGYESNPSSIFETRRNAQELEEYRNLYRYYHVHLRKPPDPTASKQTYVLKDFVFNEMDEVEVVKLKYVAVTICKVELFNLACITNQSQTCKLLFGMWYSFKFVPLHYERLVRRAILPHKTKKLYQLPPRIRRNL